MSIIYQPPGQPFNPLFQDALDNAIFRDSPNVATSSTASLATLLTKIIPGNTLNTDGKRGEFVFLGNLSGALGTKRVVVNFDATIIFDSGALAVNNQNYLLRTYIGRLLTTNLHCFSHYMTNAFGAFILTTNAGGTVQVNNIDFTLDHTLTFQAQLSNAGDSISLIVDSGCIL